mmetsp:Transcript_13998/g.24544  ORF Transcript_13998/g.24544 Transcript_13998/m.24544 type:complete len:115 (-) Transcript_13998:4-348(-)
MPSCCLRLEASLLTGRLPPGFALGSPSAKGKVFGAPEQTSGQHAPRTFRLGVLLRGENPGLGGMKRGPAAILRDVSSGPIQLQRRSSAKHRVANDVNCQHVQRRECAEAPTRIA